MLYSDTTVTSQDENKRYGERMTRIDAYCPTCDRRVTPKKRTNWLLVILIALPSLLFGAWGIIGLIASIFIITGGAIICPICEHQFSKAEQKQARLEAKK